MAYFSPAALAFLSGLDRNNDRLWFAERKAVYLREIHAPMTRLCDDVARGLAGFAAAHVKPSHKAMMRIHANVRFHPGMPPFKTHLGAWWGAQGMDRTSGAGFYLHLGRRDFEIAAGCFMPTPAQRYRIREAIARDPKRLRSMLAAGRLRALLPDTACSRLTRAPKGFSATDAALDLLRCMKWGVLDSRPPETALAGDLLAQVLACFRAAAPLVDYLNTATQGPAWRQAARGRVLAPDRRQ